MNKNLSEFLSIYFCGYEECAPGHAFGPAIRPHYLIHVVLDGKGVYRRNGETYYLKTGDAFLISPMESTFYQADEKEPWTYSWVGFDGRDAEEILSRTCFADSCIFTCPDREESVRQVTALASAITENFREPGHSSLGLQGLLFQLLGLMQEKEESSGEEYSRQYLAKAMQYMDNNFTYNIRISDIASSVGIDRTYLYRIFMEQIHLSPKQYLLKLRLRTAANMLRDSRYTITEVAYSCGFQDTAAFSSQFKTHMGMTPSKFRGYIKNELNALKL